MSVRDSKRFGFKRFLNSDCVRPTWLNKHSAGTDVAGIERSSLATLESFGYITECLEKNMSGPLSESHELSVNSCTRYLSNSIFNLERVVEGLVFGLSCNFRIRLDPRIVFNI